MKKIILILLICLTSLNFFNITNAKMYRIGTTFEKEIKFTNKFVLPLSDGKWVAVDKYSFFYYFPFKGNAIARLENNEIMELIWVEKANLSGESMGLIDQAVNEIVFKDKYDGCYERPEYFYLNFYRKGSTFNCLIVTHAVPEKEIYDPDDPELRNSNSQIKKWIREKSIELPKIMLGSSHLYFSRLVYGKIYGVSYSIDPSILNGPEISFFTEESSEYHKYNIKNYPEHKRIMQKWLSISKNRHKVFEKDVKAKERHLLNLNN